MLYDREEEVKLLNQSLFEIILVVLIFLQIHHYHIQKGENVYDFSNSSNFYKDTQTFSNQGFPQIDWLFSVSSQLKL